jgi:adenine-specific DNA-methyltransferase
MKPVTRTILKSFDKAYKIQPVSRTNIETFKANYIKLVDRVEESERRNESEENFKGHLMDFLKNTYFQKNTNSATRDSANRLVAPKGKTDFVIHTNNEGSSPAAILFEVKRPKNTAEMVSRTNLNTKAMQELMLYYFEERSKHQNNDITHLVITNIHEWFIFESNTFERLFYKNSKLLKDFKDWKDGKKVSRNNDLFYNEIAKPALDAINEDIEFTYFDIRTYEKNIRNTDLDDDKKLIELYKIFSPTHLLKLQATNDNNKLNSKFYSELLHIIGLEEEKVGGKKLIQRKVSGNRNEGSLLENCINMLESEDRLHHVKDLLAYGKGKDEQLFNIGLELCITWINRILFLKLLEAQLQKYHDNELTYKFLNNQTIQDFDVLNKLFFQVLAKPIKDRT